MKPLRRLWLQGKKFTVDILGEAVFSEDEAERYRDRYLLLVDTLSGEMAGWTSPHRGPAGTFLPLNISVKTSALYSRLGPANREDSVREVRRRLLPILAKVGGRSLTS